MRTSSRIGQTSMPEFMNAHPAEWEDIKTKKELKGKCTPTTEFYVHGAWGDGGPKNGYMTPKELSPGTKLSVTNYPKRTWFATVEFIDGKVKVT